MEWRQVSVIDDEEVKRKKDMIIINSEIFHRFEDRPRVSE